MEGMDIEDREDREDISNILFIVASCHGGFFMDGAEPQTIDLSTTRKTAIGLTNFEKKSVGGAGCGVLKSFSNANLATPGHHFPVDHREYVAKFELLPRPEQETEYQQMLSQLNPRNFSEDNPVRLTQEIIKQYGMYRDLSKTYPTQESVIEQKNARILLDELGNKLYGRVDPFSKFDLENFTCRTQKGPSEPRASNEYQEIVSSGYMLDPHDHTGLIFSFVIGGELKFYNIFYKDEINKLITDVKTSMEEPGLLREMIEHQFSKKEITNIHGRECISMINTLDVLLIAKAIKWDVGIDYVKMVDMTCRVFEADRENERSNARRIKRIQEKYIYGGFRKKSKKSKKPKKSKKSKKSYK